MKVQVLGTGCPKCKKLYAEAEKAKEKHGVAFAQPLNVDMIVAVGGGVGVSTRSTGSVAFTSPWEMGL